MRILIACGGSAGHIFPGLALAEELKIENPHWKIVFCISSQSRDQKWLRQAAGDFAQQLDIETIDAVGLPYQFGLSYLKFALRLFWAGCKSVLLVLKYAPHVVVGFGGYTSFAPLVIARLLGIPTIIHEQNLLPGRANRFLARVADRVATSFNDSNKFFWPHTRRLKIVQTGLPLRKNIAQDKRHTRDLFSAAAKKFTILVVGGSQGAHQINELVLDCLARLDQQQRSQLCLIHLTGKGDLAYVRSRYLGLNVSFRVFEFLDDMALALRACDLLIARCGASTIFEAASFGLPCLFIPYPWGTRHQIDNARFLQDKGYALMFDQQRSTGADLKQNLLELMANQALRENLSQRIRLLEVPQASNRLKEQVKFLSRGK